MAENVPKLGALITGEAERDAVHVAVVPVTADIPLDPGMRVAVMMIDGEAHATCVGDTIGIVDPFLTRRVKKGQRCYMFLDPGTVVSLRHHYRHPVLDHEEIRRETMEALNAPAVQRMKQWAEGFGLTYREAMQHTQFYLVSGVEAEIDGIEALNISTDDYPKGGTFWGDYEQLTMRPVPEEQKKDFFSCSC